MLRSEWKKGRAAFLSSLSLVVGSVNENKDGLVRRTGALVAQKTGVRHIFSEEN
jgi:hypothetical protein